MDVRVEAERKWAMNGGEELISAWNVGLEPVTNLSQSAWMLIRHEYSYCSSVTPERLYHERPSSAELCSTTFFQQHAEG
jgi:hypothetical protein